MLSGREKDPEKRSNTRRDVFMADVRVVGARWCGAGMAGSVAVCDGGGSPGGWSTSASQELAIAWSAGDDGSQGNDLSLMYTSEAMTMRLELGTQIWYAPGERTLRPRLMPTQALDSIRVLE
eukprot:4341155-Pleurochrysis_carterae.AAC.1